MSFTLTVGGTTVNRAAAKVALGRLVPFSRNGTPALEFSRLVVSMPGNADPYLGKSCTLASGGATCFAGAVVTADPERTGEGWVVHYTAHGLRYLGDRVPHTDAITGVDSSSYNLQPNDFPDYIAARAGRTVGQVIADVLTMTTNAARLNALGIGAYTSLAPPTLPAATTADLAALAVIPPKSCTIQGQRLLSAVADFLADVAPNHTLHVEHATGTIRLLDVRTFSASPTTLTLGVDPVEPPALRRDWSQSFGRVVIRGQPVVVPVMLQETKSTLTEGFSSGDKSTWRLSDFLQTEEASSSGSCTCSSTTVVVVDPSDNAATWTTNYWDQTTSGAHGVGYFTYSLGSGLTQTVVRRIVANTALVAAGTSTLTLDSALPATNYDSYVIYGKESAKSKTWRLYNVADATVAANLAPYFPYPVPFRLSDGSAETLTQYPTASIMWTSTGSAPYFESALGFTIDPTAGTILFDRPTVTLYGDQSALLTAAATTSGGSHQVPDDIRVLIAAYDGLLTATHPADIAGVPQYAGTSNTVEGRTETLYLTCAGWIDPSNQANVDSWCADILDSVKDTVVEGSVIVHGLVAAALTPGMSLNIAANYGSAVTTGWETIAIPVVEPEIVFHQTGTGPDQYTTVLKVSNRRMAHSGAFYLRPSVVAGGQALGGEMGDGYAQAAGMIQAPEIQSGPELQSLSDDQFAGPDAMSPGQRDAANQQYRSGRDADQRGWNSAPAEALGRRKAEQADAAGENAPTNPYPSPNAVRPGDSLKSALVKPTGPDPGDAGADADDKGDT